MSLFSRESVIRIICFISFLWHFPTALAQVSLAPKQLVIIKPGMERVYGTWVAAVMNKGQTPEFFRVAVLLPLEARDFQAMEGVEKDEVKLDDTGVWVEKVFPPGVNVISFAFMVPSSQGAVSLHFKTRGAVGDLTLMTPKGLLELRSPIFSETGSDVQDMEKYAVLTPTHSIAAGESISIDITGIPEGRGRLWVIGIIFGVLLLGSGGFLAWKTRSRSDLITI